MAERLIICTKTGTVLNLGDCVVVDYDALSDDDKEMLDRAFTDDDIIGVAERNGTALTEDTND